MAKAKFLVPADMYPGVARAGVGFFPPGATWKYPDAASYDAKGKIKKGDKPSKRLIPLNDEAKELLVQLYPEEAKAGLLADFPTEEAEKPDVPQPELPEQKSLGELAKQKEATRKRLADSK